MIENTAMGLQMQFTPQQPGFSSIAPSIRSMEKGDLNLEKQVKSRPNPPPCA
jgi:hypothetical protein